MPEIYFPKGALTHHPGFKKSFDYDRLNLASEQIDKFIKDEPRLIWEHSLEKMHEREWEQRKNRPQKSKKRSRDYER